MRMLPEDLDPSTSSTAEKTLFRRLGLIPTTDSHCALYSFNLAEHRWKRVAEIDFLLISPQGIFVLEVKGGSSSSRAAQRCG